MRKLPIYFVCAQSSSSKQSESQLAFVNNLVKALRQDPGFIECSYLCVMASDKSSVLSTPLTPLLKFQVPNINPICNVKPDQILKELYQHMQNEIKLSDIKKEIKGDWSPIILIFGEGNIDSEILLKIKLKYKATLILIQVNHPSYKINSDSLFFAVFKSFPIIEEIIITIETSFGPGYFSCSFGTNSENITDIMIPPQEFKSYSIPNNKLNSKSISEDELPPFPKSPDDLF